MKLLLYSTPESAIIPVKIEMSYLASESEMTESIEGRKDSDIDW